MPQNIPSILLVGAGRWGLNHLRVWLKLQTEGRCRLVGVYDASQLHLQTIGQEFGVPVFYQLDTALAKADATDIVVPTYDHFTLAKQALLAGKDVLVEKPLTASIAQAETLADLHNASGRILMVGHLFRYNPALDYVKKLLDERAIGELRFLRGRFMGFRGKEHDAGILATTAIHFIYLSNYLLGRLPVAVWAQANCLLDTKLDDHCWLRLDYGPEFTLIESDYFTPGKWRSFDLIGTQGVIVFNALDQKVELHQKKHIQHDGRFAAYDGSTLYPSIAWQEPLYLELNHFLQCIQQRSEPLTGIADGLAVLRIIAAAYQSARADRTVVLPSTRIERSQHAVSNL